MTSAGKSKQIVQTLDRLHVAETWAGVQRCQSCLRPWPCDTHRTINGEVTL